MSLALARLVKMHTGQHKRRVNIRSILFFLIGALSVLVPLPSEGADRAIDRPLKKIRIAYSGISGSQVPAWVAHERGFFRKYGLDVQLIFAEGGSRAVRTLISGDVVAAQLAGSAVIKRRLEGSGAVLIAGFLNTMDYQLVVAKDITRPEQLKGKAVAVSRSGSSSDFATRFALEKYGLEPNKDVAVLQIGGQPARFAALEAGKIQGVMIAVPLTLKAKQQGFNILADLQMLGLEYQHTGLAVMEELIKSEPDLVRDILRAFVEAIHYYKTNRKESIEILAKYLKVDEPEALEETYESIGLTLIPEKPYPTLKGIDIMLRELAAEEPKARTARPEQFVNLTFIKELDSSGFIDRLYKATPVVATREGPRPLPVPVAVKEETPPVPVVAKKEEVPPVKDIAKSAVVTPAKKSALRVPDASGLSQEYTVKAGDTLSHLALRFYGSPHKWDKIYEANAKTVQNPHYIYIGQQLLIPPADQPVLEKQLNQRTG